MPIQLRTPDKKISLTNEEMQYFLRYLDTCKAQGFTGPNNFHHQKEREELLCFSLLTFAEKVLNKCLRNYHHPSKKKLSVVVNFAEEKSLIAVFKRVDCDPFIQAVQQKILLHLRPTYSSAKI